MANYATQVEVNLQDYFDAASTGQNREEPLAAISPDTWEVWFSDWLAVLQPSLPASQGYELSLRLTNDAEIQSFNAQYRHKDQPTDVLAFAALEVDLPLFDVETPEPLYLGDIVISVETAQVQAQQQGHSLRQELAWLAAHALLHLLGWDHPDEESLLKMLQQQESLLQTIGMTSSYHQGEN